MPWYFVLSLAALGITLVSLGVMLYCAQQTRVEYKKWFDGLTEDQKRWLSHPANLDRLTRS